MGRSEKTIDQLVSDIERNALALPEMQRRYVWRATQVRDLFDSLYRGYPSGTILMWETDEEVPQRDFAVAQKSGSGGQQLLLLDGQQRLTSLAAVLRGQPVKVRGRTKPIELLFNLEHPDVLEDVTEVTGDADGSDEPDDDDDDDQDAFAERIRRSTFVVATQRIEKEPQWVRVTDVFKAKEDRHLLRAAGVQDFDDPRYDKYSARLARLRSIRDYPYRIDTLERSLSYEEVTEIFVRVNSLGAKLRSSDLALAQITAKWRNSLQEFLDFEKGLEDAKFGIDLGVILKVLVAFATGQSGFRTVSSISLDTLQSSWEKTKKALKFAIDFATTSCGIETPALLSSPFLLVTIAYYSERQKYSLTPSEITDLRRWALYANAKGRYGRGSAETILSADLTIIKDGGGPAELTERLVQQVGTLEVAPGELEGRSVRSALFKTMFLAFRAAGAQDWKNSIPISATMKANANKLQVHHIFPDGRLKDSLPKNEINDIANLAFISAAANQAIKDRLPVEYIAELVDARGSEIFRDQDVPIDPELLTLDGFPAFKQRRRELIAQRLNEFLSA